MDVESRGAGGAAASAEAISLVSSMESLYPTYD